MPIPNNIPSRLETLPVELFMNIADHLIAIKVVSKEKPLGYSALALTNSDLRHKTIEHICSVNLYRMKQPDRDIYLISKVSNNPFNPALQQTAKDELIDYIQNDKADSNELFQLGHHKQLEIRQAAIPKTIELIQSGAEDTELLGYKYHESEEVQQAAMARRPQVHV